VYRENLFEKGNSPCVPNKFHDGGIYNIATKNKMGVVGNE